MPEHPVYQATLHHLKGEPHESAAIRLFIKWCLRLAGLKCIDVGEVHPTSTATPQETLKPPAEPAKERPC